MAQCTVRVSKLLIRNCIQAHDNTVEVIRQIILYLSTRRPQIIGSPGHVRTCFLNFRISKNSVFQDQEFCPKNPQKIIKKKSRGCAPHPLLTGLRPLQPPGLGTICLFAPLLNDPDSAFSSMSTYTAACGVYYGI